MASMVWTVSRMLSPFLSDDEPALKVRVSAPRRLAAVSKLRRVRVESSKKTETTVLPRRAGTFGMARALTSTKLSVRRSTSSMPSAPRSAMSSRCLTCASPPVDAFGSDVDHLVATGGQVLAHVIGPDGQLAVAPVDHHGQLYGPGPAEVGEGVEGGPDGAPGEEHVVDQHHDLAGQVDRDVGDRLGQDRAQADVIAVEGDVEGAQGDVGLLDLVQVVHQQPGQPDAAGLETDDHHLVESVVALDDLVGHAPHGPTDVVGAHHLGAGMKNAPVRGRDTAFAFGHRGRAFLSV